VLLSRTDFFKDTDKELMSDSEDDDEDKDFLVLLSQLETEGPFKDEDSNKDPSFYDLTS